MAVGANASTTIRHRARHGLAVRGTVLTRRLGVVWGGLLGLVGCLAVVGAALAGKDGLQTSANVAQLVSVALAIPALAVPLLLWSRRTAPLPAVTPDSVAAAKDAPAWIVGQQ